MPKKRKAEMSMNLSSSNENRKKPSLQEDFHKMPCERFTSLIEVESSVYRPSYSPTGCPELEFKSLSAMFQESVDLHGKKPCLGHRQIDADGKALDYEFMSYSEAGKCVDLITRAWSAMGLKQGEKVGIIGANSREWMLAMQAINRMGCVCVPLYDSLGESAVHFILGHSEVRLVCSSSSKLETLIKGLAKARQADDKIAAYGICVWNDSNSAGGVATKLTTVPDLTGVPCVDWERLMARGTEAEPAAVAEIDSDDPCTIMYTSGTTGTPKGVVISHRAVLSSVAGIKLLLCHYGEALTSDDCFFSYLPLAHIFDRVVEELFISIGGRIGYFQGDVKKILEDVGACKPTLFAGVPRVFERIFTGLFEKVNAGGWFKKAVFRWCYKRKLARLNQGYRPEAASPLADTLVFNQVKQKLGGRVRVIVSGGAPLAGHVEEFIKVALCAPAVQGYGLTETCAASFIGNPFLMSHLGSVGVPLAHTELKLESVPEMGYDALDPNEPRGEILIRGPGLFSGYYKDEKLTAESMTSDGFFRTGDIGALVADGTLKVIDRKKNIFKLSQGEYVAVEKLESVYKKNLVSEQVWVYGNSFKSSLIAVVVPSAELKKWAAANGIEGKMDVICKSDKAKEYVLSELAKTGKAEKLKGFEIIRAVHLAPTPFTIEEDLLTPTFKLKRPQLQKSFQKEIDALYAALKE